MLWTHRHSPLDHTVATLDELASRIRRQLIDDEPLSEDEFLAMIKESLE